MMASTNKLKIVKKILVKSTEIICSNLDPEPLLRIMQAEEALSPDDVKRIRAKVTNSDQSDKLIDILMTKPTKSYEVFMGALQSVHNDVYQDVLAIEKKEGYSRDTTTSDTATDTTTSDTATGAQVVSNDDLLEIAYNAGLTKANMDTLFLALGLSQADIDNGRRNADTEDIHLQGFRVLHDEWFKKKGSAATRQVILGALKRFRMTGALEYLQKEWGISS